MPSEHKSLLKGRDASGGGNFFKAVSKVDRNTETDILRFFDPRVCFIDPRVRKIRNQASSCPGIFSRTLRFYYVASSPGSPLPHLLDGHRKLVGRSEIPARSCPGPVRYHWGCIVELEVPPDETPGLMTLHPHNTNVLQSITYANHHTHPADPRTKKLMLSTRVWLVLSDSITLQ